jgi:hypothetical protein
MTYADRHMLQVEYHRPVSCESFRDCRLASGETDVGVVEMKRYEECTVSPGKDNDVIVAVVLVVWTGTLVSVSKSIGKEDWSIGHSAHPLNGLFLAVRDGCHVGVLLDS